MEFWWVLLLLLVVVVLLIRPVREFILDFLTGWFLMG